MAKGDTVRVHPKDRASIDYTAQKGGRTLDVSIEKESGVQWLVIQTKTRGGTVVSTARFQTSELVGYERTGE
jgi:hypothetical protein